MKHPWGMRLSYIDCLPLLDKIKARISSWAVSKLSYGGRLHLINSVLLAMVRYWTAAFFLPRKVVKDIECLLRTFLWGSSHKAKIKWLDICKPKDGGVWGFLISPD